MPLSLARAVLVLVGIMDDALERDTIGMSFFDPLDDQVCLERLLW